MTVALTLSDVEDIEFPAWVDRDLVLRPLRTSSWLSSPKYRRDITRTSPLLFAITYMPHRLRHPVTGGISFTRMHLDMCAKARALKDPGPQLCSFVAPRGSGKTTWPFQILPPFWLGHEHSSNFLAFSYTSKQARGTHLKNLINELNTNELLRHDFPGLIPVRGQSSIERIVLTNGATLAAFGMMETSLGWQDVQGKRPRIMVGDDLEPPEAKNTLDEVEKNKSRLKHGVIPMGNRRAAIWVTGTTTMHNSLIHGFVHAAKGRPEGEWVHRTGFEPHYYPALDENDQSWWEQQFSAETLQDMRMADPVDFDLNYQNDPQPPADQTFWTPEIFQLDPRFPTVERVLFIDPAETTGASSDYTAMVMLGRDAGHQRACVEQVAWGRWTDPEIRTRIHDFCDSVDRIKPRVLIEGNRGGARLLHSLSPWPEGVKYETVRAEAPKFARIRRAHSLYYARKVWHLDQLPKFEAELCRWPRSKHDDVADATAGALEWAFPIPK